MKYLKIYERFTHTIQDWIDGNPFILLSPNNGRFNCGDEHLTSLKGIENLDQNIEFFNCSGNYLKNLKGIEYLKHLQLLECSGNKLTSLKGIETLINLQELYCSENKLKNIVEEIKNIPNLVCLTCYDNCFEFPLPKEISDYYHIIDLYSDEDIKRFHSYTYQKKLLVKYPEKINDLKQFGIHEKIKEEFVDLIEGNEFGFFGLKN